MEFFSPDNCRSFGDQGGVSRARPIAGGTDMMVELNFDHDRPEAVVDLTRAGAREWEPENGRLREGPGDVYANHRGAG